MHVLLSLPLSSLSFFFISLSVSLYLWMYVSIYFYVSLFPLLSSLPPLLSDYLCSLSLASDDAHTNPSVSLPQGQGALQRGCL